MNKKIKKPLNFNYIINKISQNNDLESNEATFAFNQIMQGKVSEIEISAFLFGLSIKGETLLELLSATKVLRKVSLSINSPLNTIDTCGTGGDALGTYNVSTAVAIVTAACGVPVAKHGNKAISSKSGSSDILSKLGVNINANIEKVEESLNEIGLCFLMAPLYHKAMRHVSKVRSTLGIKTIFNLLGPLINPANTKRQLIGVYHRKWLLPLAKCLDSLGSTKVWVVNGMDGMDEITITSDSEVVEFYKGKLKSFKINPKKYGMKLSGLEDIKGNSPEDNAKALKDLLNGKKNAYRDIVILNSAAALVVADKCKNLSEGISLAANNIDNGKAFNKLNLLIKKSNEQ